MMKKDYHRELTHRELEIILDVLKPLNLTLSAENKIILKRATIKLQKLFDEQNPRTKKNGPKRKHQSREETAKNVGLGPVNFLHGKK
tara:strand:+ start:385 stop:645 length:261 start_codon:yes stop_codon:yes gene_type:complete